MDILLEQDEIDYKRYVCNSEVLFDNVDRLLNCMEMLTTAAEYPEKRGFGICCVMILCLCRTSCFLHF